MVSGSGWGSGLGVELDSQSPDWAVGHSKASAPVADLDMAGMRDWQCYHGSGSAADPGRAGIRYSRYAADPGMAGTRGSQGYHGSGLPSHPDRAGIRYLGCFESEEAQAGEEGMSFQNRYTGLFPDWENDWTGQKPGSLGAEDELRHSQAGTKGMEFAAVADTGSRTVPGVVGRSGCSHLGRADMTQ